MNSNIFEDYVNSIGEEEVEQEQGDKTIDVIEINGVYVPHVPKPYQRVFISEPDPIPDFWEENGINVVIAIALTLFVLSGVFLI